MHGKMVSRIFVTLLVCSCFMFSDAWKRDRHRTWMRDRDYDYGKWNFRRCKFTNTETYDCSNLQLTDVPYIPMAPTIKSLHLNDNGLTTIHDYAFADLRSLEYLNLRNNRLTHLPNRSFVGLDNLRTLDLTQTHPFTISETTFQPLASLTNLKLGKLCNSDCMSQKLAFSYLTGKLESLEIAAPENFTFGEEFNHLQNLTTLLLYGHGCALGTVSNDTFAAFSKSLKTLEVRSCIEDMESDSLAKFQKLETLNLACNRELSVPGVFEAVKQMYRSSLKTIILDGAHSSHAGLFLLELTPEWFDSPQFENVRRLSLRQTHVASVNLEFGSYLPSLKSLNLGYNSIIKLTGNVTASAAFRNITSGDFSYLDQPVMASATFRNQYCHADIRSDDFFRQPPEHIVIPDHVPCCNHAAGDFSGMADKLMKNVPQSLLFLYASTMGLTSLSKISVNPDNNILFLDVSRNEIRKMDGTIQGMLKLQGLDMSDCKTNYVNPRFFANFPSLTYVNMSRNYLKGTDWKRLFENTRNLRVLDIRVNGLQGISKDVFTGLRSLEIAHLNGNSLRNVFINLRHNKKLKMLNLRSTELVMNDAFRKELDNLQERIGHRLQLKLGGNNVFTCNCDNVGFLEWLRKTAIDIVDMDSLQCLYHGQRERIVRVDETVLKRSCTAVLSSDDSTWFFDLLIGVCVTIIVVSLVIFVFTHWWSRKLKIDFRNMHYKLTKKRSGISPPDNENAKYYAFVSCDREDGPWVFNTLVPEVEEKWGFQLCISQRDFIAGMYVLNTITEAIELCPYVILLVTPTSVPNDTCDFAMRMCMAMRRPMIIVRKGKLDPEKMSKTLKGFVFSPECLEYSDTEEGSVLFWNTLKERLMTDPAEAAKNLHPEYTADVVKENNFFDDIPEIKCEYNNVLCTTHL